jgi:beta-lactamase class A
MAREYLFRKAYQAISLKIHMTAGATHMTPYPPKAPLTRRAVLAGAALLLPPARARAQSTPGSGALAALEASSGARIGLAAVDTGGGAMAYHADERFIMCSSFKMSLAAAVLARADQGRDSLERVVRYGKSDLMDVSPDTTRNLANGMTVAALCEAAVIYSDNAAANLLLGLIGGPAALTGFWRGIGDTTSRLDRIEPALNIPDGDKDTTTPAAILATLRTLLLGDALTPASRQRLRGWMEANTTGGAMLRAGLPPQWAVGDKTGRYMEGEFNAAIDLAIATPPGRKPILIAAFTMNGKGDAAAHQALVADIGRVVAKTFA